MCQRESRLRVGEDEIEDHEEQEGRSEAYAGANQEGPLTRDRSGGKETGDDRSGRRAGDDDQHQRDEDEDHTAIKQLLFVEVTTVHFENRLEDSREDSADVGAAPEDANDADENKYSAMLNRGRHKLPDVLGLERALQRTADVVHHRPLTGGISEKEATDGDQPNDDRHDRGKQGPGHSGGQEGDVVLHHLVNKQVEAGMPMQEVGYKRHRRLPAC